MMLQALSQGPQPPRDAAKFQRLLGGDGGLQAVRMSLPLPYGPPGEKSTRPRRLGAVG